MPLKLSNFTLNVVVFFFISIMPIIGQTIRKGDLGIIPLPNKIVFGNQYAEMTNIRIYIGENEKSSIYTQLFYGIPKITEVNRREANVFYAFQPSLGSENYILTIEEKDIRIEAGSNAALQYALTSLAQMVLHHGLPLPTLTIEDSPKFKYRGMHLDVARHFFSVEDVKKYLDYMAYYKFNNFHWHLTDDQGWRIEIKKYPKLQEIGAFRKETLIGHYGDQPHKFDGTKYGGFYTQEEIKEIVTYATARNINVIPEIEMPGHALAALSAYPELGCEDKKYETATKWGVFEDVFCPTEKTFTFLEGVIDEVITLFPSKYIHIGGDECPKDAWKKSEFCQDLIRNNQLKDEHGLQSFFITHMEKYINSKGKQIIGWDEILEGGLAPNATVMSWRGIDGGIEAARQNHDVIMTPGTHCYFDHYQSEGSDEPIAIGGYTSVEKVYHWEPIPTELEESKRQYILGGQANLWTEYIHKFKDVEYMAFARGIAMSEALWSYQKKYSEFVPRYEIHNEWWKNKGVNIANHIYELKPKISAGDGKGVSVSFELPKGSSIEYTTAKDQKSIATKDNINITTSDTYSFAALKGDKMGQPKSIVFDLHKATNALFTLESPPSPKYPGNGPSSIVNGVIGSDKKYGGSEWLGFSGTDCNGVINFGKVTDINTIDLRFFKVEGQWIYLPSKIEIFASDDGINYKSKFKSTSISSDTKICKISIDLKGVKSQYLKFNFSNYGVIPDGAQGAGHKAWLFVDEIVVK
jgi:hexosaminidase